MLKSQKKWDKISKNYCYFTSHRYNIDVSKYQYLKFPYDTDTNISISAIYRRYFRYIDPPLLQCNTSTCYVIYLHLTCRSSHLPYITWQLNPLIFTLILVLLNFLSLSFCVCACVATI